MIYVGLPWVTLHSFLHGVANVRKGGVSLSFCLVMAPMRWLKTRAIQVHLERLSKCNKSQSLKKDGGFCFDTRSKLLIVGPVSWHTMCKYLFVFSGAFTSTRFCHSFYFDQLSTLIRIKTEQAKCNHLPLPLLTNS